MPIQSTLRIRAAVGGARSGQCCCHLLPRLPAAERERELGQGLELELGPRRMLLLVLVLVLAAIAMAMLLLMPTRLLSALVRE